MTMVECHVLQWECKTLTWFALAPTNRPAASSRTLARNEKNVSTSVLPRIGRGTASAEERCFPDLPKKKKSTLGTILLIILIIALLGGFRDWGRGTFYGTATTAAAAWASCL
jgi:hypothetical protein